MCGGIRRYTAVYGAMCVRYTMVYGGIRRYTGLCVYGIRLVYDGIRCTSGYGIRLVYDWYTIGIRLVYGCCTSHVTLEGSLMKTVEIILEKHVIKLKLIKTKRLIRISYSNSMLAPPPPSPSSKATSFRKGILGSFAKMLASPRQQLLHPKGFSYP